ncbi:oxygen-independent coproporphyrinogen III oxidase [Devosia albogilva]|uniref:Coproporphyrinogen-III oxidase n=1 Tax=Devosia albogilva TaxID=429726 RepID=A0ABW5QHU3_9HYPH
MTDMSRLLKPVPRYTSYPTAPHFHKGIGPEQYFGWLAALPPDAHVSLYLHLPFCDRLCWFCGCHTKQVNRYDPIAVYLEALTTEIRTIGAIVGERPVTAVHWGGGSPSMMTPEDIVAVNQCLRTAFRLTPDAEFSVELDPNDMDEERFDAWSFAGMTRASIGVQDFDPKVQQAINRIQTFEHTKGVVDAVHKRGVKSVNIDMLYGLPHQTEAGAVETARQVRSLGPNRVALFGYAHVPWMKKHQTMIDENYLPDAAERFRQSLAAAAVFTDGGYDRIGFDHFAMPDDSMAIAARTGTLARNFQGYTADRHDALIGLGASAIGRLPQGYVQNVVATHEYQRRILAGEGALERGVGLSEDDRVRGYAIERLMCQFELDFSDLRHRFGAAAEPVIEDAISFAGDDPDELAYLLPGRLMVSDKGRPFVRTVAASLDAYLAEDKARYSKAV